MRFISLLLFAFLLIAVEADRKYFKKYWRKSWQPKCSPIKCDEGCVEETGSDGCPICICKPICPQIECEPGCNLKKLPDSPCPTCECFEDIEEVDAELFGKEEPPRLDERSSKPQCSPPKCPEGCEIETNFIGTCPGCKCVKETVLDVIAEHEKPLCSPPKCPPECEIEKEFVGPCPGCICSANSVHKSPDDAKGRTLDIPDIEEPKSDCAEPVKCESDCREVIDEKGCFICDCKPLCNPPKCGPGCHLEQELKSPCPECICEKEGKEEEIDEKKFEDDVKDCEPLTDECKNPGCTIRVDEKGCDVCKCEPLCSPPKCPRRCKIEKSEGECPKCACPKFRYFG